MSRMFGRRKVFICCLVLAVAWLQVNGDEKKKTARADPQATNVGENMVVSLINTIFNNDFFKSGIESSVRSVFSKPITSAVYAMSVLAGIVAMLAFYESPVSPMPVPPLPDPPVGRFPPEHPIWPPTQKDAMQMNGMNGMNAMNDKKRAGIMGQYPMVNQQMHQNGPQVHFPQVNQNQKFSEIDPTSYAGAYQQLMNVLENRNSKNPVKQNRISSNLVMEQLGPSHVYSTYNIEADPKVVNDSVKLQSLYSEAGPTDRHDTVDVIKQLYNQNNYNRQVIKEYNNLKKSATAEKSVNYTMAAVEPIANRKNNKP